VHGLSWKVSGSLGSLRYTRSFPHITRPRLRMTVVSNEREEIKCKRGNGNKINKSVVPHSDAGLANDIMIRKTFQCSPEERVTVTGKPFKTKDMGEKERVRFKEDFCFTRSFVQCRRIYDATTP
jgi:hypothetical protein